MVLKTAGCGHPKPSKRTPGAATSVRIRDVVEKAGTDHARCVFDGAARNRWQEVRLWMFGCAGMSGNV